MQIVSTDNAPKAIGPYSQAIKAWNFVFVSGQIPLNSRGEIVRGGIKEQTKQALENLKAVLEASGSSLNKVAKTTVFLKNMNDFQAMNEVYSEYFKEHRPARSTIQVSRLPKDADVEVEAIASL